MINIQYPNVSAAFYPSDANELRAIIKTDLDLAPSQAKKAPIPKALIAPHAGYIYSAPIAASAYAFLSQPSSIETIKKIAVIAPSHFYAFNHAAISSANCFNTPLGNIEIDRALKQELLENNLAEERDQAFEQEHALEVQLPFLQYYLKNNFLLTPILLSHPHDSALKLLFNKLWKTCDLLVISSDLSHYLDYVSAKKLDQKTADAILALEPNKIKPDQACGFYGIRGLLMLAKEKNCLIKCLDLRNSGDTAGDRSRVVGYGAFHIYE